MSKFGFVRAFVNECQSVFLDGHVRAFEHFGGVPGRIRYDNLKAAVVKVLKGRTRVEAERFVALRSHYGSTASSASPGSKAVTRKGGVESEVGRFRRRHLVPVPSRAPASVLDRLDPQPPLARRLVEQLGTHDEPVEPEQCRHAATVPFHQGPLLLMSAFDSRVNSEAPTAPADPNQSAVSERTPRFIAERPLWHTKHILMLARR